MNKMLYLCFVGLSYGLSCMSANAQAIDDESAKRLEALLGLNLEELQEVEVKLDDVFDIFDGLLKRPKVKAASGFEQDAAIAPSVTTVITAQDIEATGARNLEEVLGLVPGLYVGHTSNNNPIFIIRGIYTGQNFETLFLVNGVPLKSALDGNRTSYVVLPSIHHISRVEVIRGPGSALYGADAFAGVINIITKEASEIDSTEVGVRGGSFHTYDAWVQHGGQWGDVDVVAALQYGQTDGPQQVIEQDLQSLLDVQFGALIPNYQPASFAPGPFETGVEALDAHLDLRYQGWQAQISHQSQRDRRMGAFVLNIDPLGTADVDYTGVDVAWHNTSAASWDTTVKTSFRRFHETVTLYDAPPGAFLPGPCLGGLCFYPEGVISQYDQTEFQWRLGVSTFYTGLSKHTIGLGAGYALEDLAKTNSFRNRGTDRFGNFIQPEQGLVDLSDGPTERVPEVNRRNWYLLIQDTWDFAQDWQLTLGIRYDDYSDFGSTLNPRTSLVWRTTDTLTSKLLYGRAFRAPSFLESFIFIDIVKGNPNLEPETIDSFELAFDYQITPDLHATLNFFYYEIEDKIAIMPTSVEDLTFTYVNFGNWQGKGLEFETRWKVSATAALLFNYAYTNTREDEPQGGSHELGRYPHHAIYLRGDWMFRPNWYLDVQLNAVLDRARAFDDLRPSPDDYITTDVTLRYKDIRKKQWNLAAGIKNLLDEDVRADSGSFRVPNDYPQAGRNWFVEMRYQFD